MTQHPRIEQRDAQSYAAVRRSGTADGFQAAVDSGFPALFGWLAEQGVEPAGPPFIRYIVFEPEGAFEIDIAAPVADGLAGDARVRCDRLPAGDYAVHLHRGAYRATTERWEGKDLAAAHLALDAWARSEGVEWDGWESDAGPAMRAAVERFLVGPMESPDPETWETELAYLVRG